MLYRNADILIFDEPTAVLTPQEIDSLLHIIQNLRNSGKTIILITHKLDEIKKIADRCAILCKGKLVGVLSVENTTTNEMSALMVGHEISDGIEKTAYAKGAEILKVDNLTVVSSQNVTLVDKVSFTVHRGEILAIAGVSGNGQVEIADALAGLLSIHEGTVLLEGKDITHIGIRKRIESGISYIPEDRHSLGLILDLSLRENLCLKQYYQMPYCKQNGILDFSKMKTLGTKLISEFDIRCSNGDNTVVRSMSGGNQQKAIIAREIELNSKLLIFVQPTRGLDVGAIESIHERINTLRSQGKAILLISLELDEVMKLADTILVMYNGQIQTIRKATELTKLQVGEYMMGVHVEKK
jgi:simple sugar transport system ATP-binding protein